MTRIATAIGFLALLASACEVGNATLGRAGADAGADDTCVGPLGPPVSDFSGMDACCQEQQGEGHCLDTGAVPDEIEDYLDGCEGGGVCVPDQFLRTGGAEPPTSCTAFGGDGVCLSICIPQVAENAGLLRPDVCDGDELCVPCISPIDDMPTGACDLAEHTVCEGADDPDPTPSCDDPATCEYEAGCEPVIDPEGLPACAPDAHCVEASLVQGAAPDVVDRLAPCADPDQLCVPDLFLETGGAFIPEGCTSVNGAEGRCLSAALPDVAAQQELLPQDACAATERCVPCYDPIDGTDTGACTLSCDPGPTEEAQPLADCCDSRARCVPVELIDEDEQENLKERDCDDIEEDAYLCVPTELLQDGPFPACEASSLIIGDYEGVCLSDCLSFGLQGLALGRGTCDNDYKCVPCEQNGEPTGAPGCP